MRSMIAALIAACFVTSVSADLVATGGGDELRLMNRACEHADILETLKPEYHSQFKAGQATIGGKVIRVCWIVIEGEDAVYVQFEWGSGQTFLLDMFKETGI